MEAGGVMSWGFWMKAGCLDSEKEQPRILVVLGPTLSRTA